MPDKSIVFHNAASATAVGEVFTVRGEAIVQVQISGTFVASVAFEATTDGANYVERQAMNVNNGVVATTATAAGIYMVPVAGHVGLRCNLTWTSGTSITVKGVATAISPGLSLADIEATIGGIAGDVAHDAADSGNPVKFGGKAETTAPAAVSDADRVDAWFDEYGRLVVALFDTSGSDKVVEVDATGQGDVPITLDGEEVSARTPGIAASSDDYHGPAVNTAAVVTKTAAGAGVKYRLHHIWWSYTGGDPTSGNLKIEDGATTVRSIDIPKEGPGFWEFDPPLYGTANTNLVLTLAAGGSGVTGKINVHVDTE